jgi:glyoxylase-like metal-dependent hydrolase (beta-lactamase superfamily II)
MKKFARRRVLQAGVSGLVLTSGLVACSRDSGETAQSRSEPVVLPPTRLPVRELNPRVRVISGAPGNVLVLAAEQGVALVDAGSAALAPSVQLTLDGAAVHTLFNTHYHPDQSGGNPLFGAAGARIHAHKITWQWLSADYYVPADDVWVPALPEVGRPTETFREQAELLLGEERIEMGYLLEAHTRGDMYVYLRDSNILAVGDVASPERDPALDWYAGGWLGGRVDAMDDLLEVANADTLIVPAYGPVMTYAELQAERDMMWHLWERMSTLVNKGRSAQDLIDAGVMDEINRKFQDPYRFCYDVAKGLWAHYTNFGGNVV